MSNKLVYYNGKSITGPIPKEAKLILTIEYHEDKEYQEKKEKYGHNFDSGWVCKNSPSGHCDYSQEDGSFDEDCCRYCGEPDERK